jgi:oligopeptide/dipeptide ABC transporter ATP-binding protein
LHTIENLTVQYAIDKTTAKTALENVSMTIPGGGYTVGIVGESGSGKTTLGMSMMNLIEPPGRVVSGRIDYMGKNILEMSSSELRAYRWGEVSMVYQSAMNSLNPVKTVIWHLTEVIRAHTPASNREATERALDLLAEVGIRPERAYGYAHEFSGGMRQRVVIAMALALSPKLMIADEPTSALDVVVQRQILTLVRKKVEQNKLSLVFITHEIAILSGLVDNVAVLHGGEIVETGPIDKVLNEPLHPYSEMLLGSLLTLDFEAGQMRKFAEAARKLEIGMPEKGCKYANRCKYAFERCRRESPVLQKVQGNRWVACHKYD